MAKFCTNCGKELPENAAICVNCGNMIGNNDNNKKEKKKGLPTWAIVLIVIGCVVLIPIIIFAIFAAVGYKYIKDNDINILGYNIFERIAKEGRKFGVVIDLITQRPTELSETVLSQCSNFLIFKINHPSDLEYIEKMVPNISSDVIEKQKSLQSGTCVAFGKMMKIPMIVKMQLPNPTPQSSNANVFDKWMIQWKS